MKAVMSGCVEFCYCGNQMTEGRRSEVVFLDERRLEILIQPKLYAGELLDLVASHFNLKEKEFFGLAFYDDTDHYNWLQLDRRVLDHELKKKTSNDSTLVFYFLVKFFIESIVYLRDTVTAELFYLQAKSLVFKGQIEVDSDTAFQLAAHVLQANNGDHQDDTVAKNSLKKLPVLPIHILKEHPSLSYCEDKVLAHYKKLNGLNRGACVVNYMTIVEGLPTYGVHYFEVKDKSGIPWWLGLSFKGVAQYDYTDKKTPRKVFQWKQLENLYFRDRKFSIEVHDPRRVSVSRRTFGPGNVTVHAWFAATPHLTQCIWSMAISQHQFYLDRKQNKSSCVRNLSDIASELNDHCLSPSNENQLNNNPDDGNRNSALLSCHSDEMESEVSRAARFEMMSALKARKDALEAKLQEKNDQLKLLCIKEAELTGELPPELPLAPGEAMPHFRKRVGTAFSLPQNLINRIKSKEEEVLAKLELDYEIQNKIASAALKLANDVTAKKSVRKQRKITYQQAHTKLKEIEERLQSMRTTVAHKKQMRHHVRKKQPRPSSDGEDHNDDSNSHSTEENDTVSTKTRSLFPSQSSLVCLEDVKNHVNRSQQKCDFPSIERPRLTPSPNNTSSSSTSSLPGRTRHHTPSPSLPASPIKQRTSSGSSRNSSPCSNRFTIGGYIPNPVYNKSGYRSQQYPTLNARTSNHADYDNVHFAGGAILNPAYRSKYDANVAMESRGLYSVPKSRSTGRGCPSQEELQDGFTPVWTGYPNPHRRYTGYTNQNRYGSLDRTLYGTHATHVVPPTHNAGKIESRSLDNLDYGTDHPNQEVATPSTCGSRETFELVSSQDYLDCPISPHFPGDGIKFGYNETPSAILPTPVHLGYTNYVNPEWYTNEGYTYTIQERSSTFPTDRPISKTDDASPARKSKEWYETSLDSPAPARRTHSSPVPSIRPPSQISPATSIQPRESPDSEGSRSFVHVPCETPQNHVVVSQGQFQPYREVTKPYELSDYFKYSTKVRKRSQSSGGASDDGGGTTPTSLDLKDAVFHADNLTSPLSPKERLRMLRDGTRSPVRNQLITRRSPSPYAVNQSQSSGSNQVQSPEVTSVESKESHVESSPAPVPAVGEAFHEEMLAWYEEHEAVKKATLV